jgi:hypothetical protein
MGDSFSDKTSNSSRLIMLSLPIKRALTSRATTLSSALHRLTLLREARPRKNHLSSLSILHTPIPTNASSTIQPLPAKAFFSTTRAVRQEAEEGAEEVKEMDDGEKNIWEILTREFQPAHLQVSDVSGACSMKRV